jgi:hypothetical protein
MMMRLRFLLPALGLSWVAACSGGDGPSDDGDGGAGGEGTPAQADAGAGGEGTPGAGGAACSEQGSGTLVIEVSGLPVGVAPDISIAGPDMLNATEEGPLEDVAAGDYVVTADRVFDEDPIVRTVFDATVTTPPFCLTDGDSQTIKVTYTAIPSSNKLWMPTDMDDELAGFSSSAISASGMTDASVSIDAPGSKSIAFDQDGNLWAVGPTLAEDMLARFKAADLGESGTRAPDVHFNVPEIECIPAIANIAFDAAGNLWLSACGGEVHRIAAAELTGTGDKTSDVLLAGLTENDGLAFDADGNLWVGGGPKLVRYDAVRLDTSDADPPDLSLQISAAIGAKPIKADVMAFDKAGNLWGVDEGGNFVFQIAASDLAQTGDKAVTAEHSFVVEVTALPTTPAFDDSNNLWVGLSSDQFGGQFGGFSPAQLGMSKDTGAPVTPAILINSASVGTGLPIAFFPAPAGLPLFHSIPAP